MQKLLGKKLSVDELQELLTYAKGDLEDYDKTLDEVKVDFGDTNLPYLWSIEGIARLLKGILGKEKGIPPLKINKENYKIVVENSVTPIRPFISAFVAKDCKIDEYIIRQMIQLQEKLCETYGMKRKKVAIGIYDNTKIHFPIHYKAIQPDKIRFTPLEFNKELDLKEILEEHPKGQEYAWILEGQSKYPILIDSEKNVLSFPPIINAEETGKVTESNTELFIEVTGDDLNAVELANNIFAYALHDRGFKIFSVDIKYPNKKITTPFVFNDSIKVGKGSVEKVLGISLNEAEIKKLLEKQRYDYTAGKVLIPPYRKDIMHEVDVIEDIGIAYGYNNIEEDYSLSFTIGSTRKIGTFINSLREIMTGLGFQEIMSTILSSKNLLYNKMEIEDFGSVELQDPTSENYSVIRSWLTPIVMDVLARNKHVEYPQRVFEQGLVTVRNDNKIIDYEGLAGVIIEEKADFTKIKQALDVVMRLVNVDYEIEETDHTSFIKGRVGRVIVYGTAVAYIGEISPQVLSNFNLEMPAVAFELNVTELYRAIKNK